MPVQVLGLPNLDAGTAGGAGGVECGPVLHFVAARAGRTAGSHSGGRHDQRSGAGTGVGVRAGMEIGLRIWSAETCRRFGILPLVRLSKAEGRSGDESSRTKKQY